MSSTPKEAGPLFSLTLESTGKGLLWALFNVAKNQQSGVLTIEWEKYKKQIAFKKGEPMSIKSNWANEAFASFISRKKIIEPSVLQKELREKEQSAVKEPLGEWLVKKGILPAAEMAKLLEDHFRERLFNLLALSHGKLRFTSMGDDFADTADSVRLSASFIKLLWEYSRSLFTESVSKQKLSPFLSRMAQVRGDFPLPLAPQELRVWNQLKEKSVLISALTGLQLSMTAAANEFDLIEWGEAPAERLLKELKVLEEKFAKAKPFEILGVEGTTSIEDCKKAFHELVKKYHPDRLPQNPSPELRQLAERVFARINDAFATMTDPEKRREFEADLELERAGGMAHIQQRLEAELNLGQAKAALKRRHFKAALDAYNQIANVLDDDAEVVADRAYAELMCLVEMKADLKSKAALLREQFQKALSGQRSYAPAYYYRGLLSKLEGNISGALEDFEEAMNADPKLVEASSEARVLRMRMGKPGGPSKKGKH